MTSEMNYEGREQTLVKHLILKHYLRRFAHIVGSHWGSITYVDGFAGPWNVQSEDLEDSSFAIALQELRLARKTHEQLRLRCFFLEQNKEAYGRLCKFSEQVNDAEVKTLNGTFEGSIKEILSFIHRGGSGTFPFIFIDPTGWTGFALKTISPLLQLPTCEVLINFMTGHIRRFLSGEESRSSFEALFGSPDFRDRIEGLTGLDREDAAVLEYSDRLKREGGFDYLLRAIVLHPDKDRTHFHLVYATRNPKGVEVFKEAEKRVMAEMERLRGRAQERKRESKTGQLSFLSSQEIPESAYYGELRERYLSRAKDVVLTMLKRKRSIPYEEAWTAALAEPLVWESDLKEWIRDWRASRSLHISGLGESQRVPKRGAGQELIWRGHAK
jgi:three-Cys-motif partner protein